MTKTETTTETINPYFYDGDGLRVSRTDNLTGLTTYYVWDSENPTGYPQVVEEIENNQVVRRYGYGLFLENVDIWNGTSFERFYVVRDGTNSVRMLLDSAGSIAATYDYDAFGNILRSTINTPITTQNSFGFHSEYKDPTTGLVYLRARWYEPREGRFLCKDEFEGTQEQPMTLNKYLGFSDNPVNLKDPLGTISINVSMGEIYSYGILGIEPKIQMSKNKSKILIGISTIIRNGIKTPAKHSYLVLFNEKGIVDFVLEGVPEVEVYSLGNEYTSRYGKDDNWGRLVKIYSNNINAENRNFEYYVNVKYGEDEKNQNYTIFRSKILNAFNRYQNNRMYRLIPTLGQSGNCHSLIGTVLRKSGINQKQQEMIWMTGWDTDVY